MSSLATGMEIPTKSKYPMIPVDEALQIVMSKVSQPIGVESLVMEKDGAEAFIDRVMAEDAVAKEALPPFRASIMDGYAVIASDGIGTYDVVGEITAGVDITKENAAETYDIQSGQVLYITTGAPLPPSADAVVRIEDTERVDGKVKIMTAVKPGKWVRPIGSDVALGQVVVEKNTRLSSAEIGLLAAVGATNIKVFKKPIVCVVSTGDELVEPWSDGLGNGKIRDSNRFMLIAAAKTSGAKLLNLGIVQDKRTELKETLRNALEDSDIVVTSGGVSMGSLDLIKGILEDIGTVHFGRMCMKPGKPTTFATITSGTGPNRREKLFFGLPGNPVSALVTFHLLVDPAIKALTGVAQSKCHHPRVNARINMPLKLDSERPEYHRSILTWRETPGTCGEFVADSTGIQRSSRLLSMRNSSALLCLPQGNVVLNPGEVVPALLISSNPVPPPTYITPHLDPSLIAKIGTSAASDKNASSPTEMEGGEEEAVCACCGVKKSNLPVDDTPPPRNGGEAILNSSCVRIGVLTISDRASKGIYRDQGGPEVLRCVNDNIKSLWESEYRIIPDDQRLIESTICDLSDRLKCNIVITTGGTGPAKRDVTPDATINVCDRIFPGFGERMRQISLKYVPTAILSRQTAGTRGNTFIINLPGSPHSVRQILPSVFDAIIHMSFMLNKNIKIIRKDNDENIVDGNIADDTDNGVFEHLFIIDKANYDWFTSKKMLRSGLSEHTILRDVFQMIFEDIHNNISVQDEIFTVPRGKGRKKQKTKILLKLSDGDYQWLLKMKGKYDLPDIDKTMRIILDYVLENEE